jgi:hypothetical protein
MRLFLLLLTTFVFIGAGPVDTPNAPKTIIKSTGCPTDWSVCPIDEDDEFLEDKSPTALQVIDWVTTHKFPTGNDAFFCTDPGCNGNTLAGMLKFLRFDMKAAYINFEPADYLVWNNPPYNVEKALDEHAERISEVEKNTQCYFVDPKWHEAHPISCGDNDKELLYRIDALEDVVEALDARVAALENP